MNPKLHIIAGPNGAGKTTFSEDFLPAYTHSREFVNADIIAQRMSPGNPESSALRAGREMLHQINALAEQRVDFSMETTLSGRSYAPWLRQLKSRGYEIHLYFLWLPDVQMCLDRVSNRVKHGGHHIPEIVIRRRYKLGIENLFQLYRPLLESWLLFDNSRRSPYLIAQERRQNLVVMDTLLFAKCCNMPINPTNESLKESAEQPFWLPALMALRKSKLRVIDQHLKSGHPLVIWRDGKVYHQPPEEAKREMDELMKNPNWLRMP
jgi:predicted ABC-type ATPase